MTRDAHASDAGAPPRDDITTPDPLFFQQATMLMLHFRFRGSRKVVASRLMTGFDFLGELEAHLPVLDRCYPNWRVSAVEVISYQHGGFYYDPWPDGLRLVQAHQAQRGGSDAPDGDPDDLPDDHGDEHEALSADAPPA